MEQASRTNDHDTTEQTLWQRWQSDRSASVRGELFDFYAPWSRVLARYFYRRYPHPLSEYADYLSLASMGLLQAIDAFDPTRGTRFKTYAEPYIKGAVLRGLSCYTKDRQAVSLERLASLNEGEHSEDDDLTTIINATLGLAFGFLLELDIADSELGGGDPQGAYERHNEAEVLSRLVEQLTPGERQVITGHYYQQLSFAEISRMMGVTKSRVSQLHGQGLKKLRRFYELVNT